MTLKLAVQAWDGKSKKVILDLYDELSGSDKFAESLLEIAPNPECADGATWLLKHWFEQGNKLTEDQIAKFCLLSDVELPWQSVLHILQILPYIVVPEQNKFSMINFVRRNTEHENKFVRAWAYNALYELADIYPEFREGLFSVLGAAEETEPPAVKARIRNIKKAIKKNW